jgi:thymidine phosphorylase
MPTAPREAVVKAPRAGYVAAFDTRAVGVAACVMGAGRQTKEDAIDHGVGLSVGARIGDRVQRGQPLFTARYRKQSLWEAARPLLERAVTLGEEPVKPPRLIARA